MTSNFPFDTPAIADLADSSTFINDPLSEDMEFVLKMAWVKFDDLFDSFEGGPHLEDRSKKNFTPEKTALLLGYAVNRINYGNPPLTFTAMTFPYGTDSIVLSQSLVLEIILHLIRSYTEQPTPQGSGYAHLSRKDYAQAWTQVYNLEKAEFDEMVRFFRRKYLGLGHTAGLIRPRSGYGVNINRGLLRSRGWFF